MPTSFEGSIFSDVVDAVGLRVLAALEDELGLVPVYVRKRPVLLEGDDLPCVVVAPGPNGEEKLFQTFGRYVAWGYPVACIVYSRGNAIQTVPIDGDYTLGDVKAEEEYANHMRLRKIVRDCLDSVTLPDVPTVFNGEIFTAPAVEVSAVTGGKAALYMVSAITVVHHSWEQRNAA